MGLVLFSQVPNLVNGGVAFADLFPVVIVVEGTGSDLLLEPHEVLIEFVVHHEHVVV